MKHSSLRALFVCLLAGVSLPATSVVYDNTTNDSGFTINYLGGSLTQIGDDIQLSGGATTLLNAQTLIWPLFTPGPTTTGVADITFEIYEELAGNTVGPLLYTTTQAAVAFVMGSPTLLIFENILTAVPGNLIFAISVANMSPDMDLGLAIYGPLPSAGMSDGNVLYTNFAGPLQFAPSGFGDDNLYFQATGVPEPGTWAMLAAGLGLILAGKRRMGGVA